MPDQPNRQTLTMNLWNTWEALLSCGHIQRGRTDNAYRWPTEGDRMDCLRHASEHLSRVIHVQPIDEPIGTQPLMLIGNDHSPDGNYW